ncbi:uncharacterized protein LOC127261086 isoform X3 [Andrographis paniculata]|uniref:uncharacterized protein LOC127261086 isoform X3 n=1 Tax=Andrographis paniculata TaxID=175694 RepID=UPI0021E899D2|nr:uncharacterized protein LOC127261086 isoform X3 [Andrographis paniculata]
MNSLRRQPRSLHTATAGKKVSHALVNLVRVCRRKKRRTQRNLKSPMVLVEGGGSSRTTILNMSHYLNALNNTMVVFITAATVLKATLNLQTTSRAQTLRLSTSSQSTGHSKISFVTRNSRICSL